MFIKGIIDMTQYKPIAEIAGDEQETGEKMTRKALKLAGCYVTVGQVGWHCEEGEVPENLEKSIYYFADRVRELERN